MDAGDEEHDGLHGEEEDGSDSDDASQLPGCSDPSPPSTLSNDCDPPLSKKAAKRLIRKQNTQLKRQAQKEAQKQAKRARREANQAEWDALPEEAKTERRAAAALDRQKRDEINAAAAAAKAAAKAAITSTCGGGSASGSPGDSSMAALNDDDGRQPSAHSLPTCVIDLDFEGLMNEKEIASLAQQISYSYSANRKANFPLRLALTSLGGEVAAKLTAGYENWPVILERRSYLEAFPDRSRVVYLSSESEVALDSLDPGVAYVVGGLVDHNRHKGLTHANAARDRVQTARLPIDEHLEMAQRRVLAVNHVVEILVLRASGLSWPDALVKVMPERRHAKSRSTAPQQAAHTGPPKLSGECTSPAAAAGQVGYAIAARAAVVTSLGTGTLGDHTHSAMKA